MRSELFDSIKLVYTSQRDQRLLKAETKLDQQAGSLSRPVLATKLPSRHFLRSLIT
jgi:hypothetical protein